MLETKLGIKGDGSLAHFCDKLAKQSFSVQVARLEADLGEIRNQGPIYHRDFSDFSNLDQTSAPLSNLFCPGDISTIGDCGDIGDVGEGSDGGVQVRG